MARRHRRAVARAVGRPELADRVGDAGHRPAMRRYRVAMRLFTVAWSELATVGVTWV